MSAVGQPHPMVMSTSFPPGPPGLGMPADVGGLAAGLTARDVWRVIKQHKVMIVVTFCILYVLVGAATFLIRRYAPQYRSEAYIELIPPLEESLKPGERMMTKDQILLQLATQAAQIKDALLLQEVLAQPEIKETQYFRWFGNDFEKCLEDLRDRLDVTPVRDTRLIRVGLAVREKSEATLIVRTIVDRFLQRSRSAATDEFRRRLDTLKNTKAQIESELTALRERISQRRAQRDVPALEADRQVQSDVIAVLNNTLAELKTRFADIEAQLATVRGVDPRNLPLSAEMKVIIESDPVLRYYRQLVEDFDVRIDAMKQTQVGAEHRTMQSLLAQRAAYAEKEAARREELIDDLRGRQIESLQQERARVLNMQAEVREQLSERENAQRDLDRAIQELEGMKQDEERLGQQLSQVAIALREAENELTIRSREGTMNLVIPPRDATSPSRPNYRLYLGGGFVLSLLAALGLAFLREVTDQALRTPLDVARYGQLPVLGCIPLLDEEQVDIEEMEWATRRAPQSLVAEAFRQVRAHLTFSGPAESQRVLLVTSPRPDDGKTVVAINLAVTFAQGNQRTLLIDCNFRRPGIRRAFGNLPADGLSNVLAGRAELDSVIRRTDIPGLDVLTSGPMPPNPAELLSSPMMRDLLAGVRQTYERVVLDGPPCLLISDALIMATLADAVVLVARAVNGTKGTLRRAREQLARVNARVIGAVLNGVQARPGGYFRQQYREFYEYTEEGMVLRELPEGPGEADGGTPGRA
jgi:succinoglycan biosynthesis transport protein ExoP